MTNDTETISIRLPEEIVEKIDKMIETLGHHTTRPSYVVSSMETMFRQLVDARIKIDEQLEEAKERLGVDPNIILEITQSFMDKYVKKYEQYSGKPIQILLRVPAKLLKDIDDYSTVLGFYSKRIDFIRISVVDQLSNDESFIMQMEQVRDHKVRQKQTSDDIIKSVLTKLNNNPKSMSGLFDLMEMMLNETNERD